jgi:hypothetical protein
MLEKQNKKETSFFILKIFKYYKERHTIQSREEVEKKKKQGKNVNKIRSQQQQRTMFDDDDDDDEGEMKIFGATSFHDEHFHLLYFPTKYNKKNTKTDERKNVFFYSFTA